MQTSETELLIQSTSTLLSLVHPLTGLVPKRRSPKLDVAPFLDRFSVIFVSGRRHANAVATVPIIDLDKKKLQVVAMTQDEPVEQEEGEQGLHQDVIGFAGELQEDEISFFIRRGHDALTFDLHVRHPEWLLNRTYKRDAPEPTPDDLDRLKQYVYLSCVVKIKQRFDMELSGGRGKFIDFFLGTDRKTHRVAFETYEKLPQAEPPHRFPDFKPKWTRETLLVGIAKLFKGQLNLDAADPTSIKRTTQAGYRVYVCIAIHLPMLHRGLTAIAPYVKASPNLRIVNPENKKTVKNALDDIEKAQAFLHWALSHSRAFWRTILTMGTHFQDQVDGAAASSASLLSTSGEQAKADESTFAASLVDDSADQLATETNDESDAERSIDETGDDFDPPNSELPIIRKI
ncbi:hypothetical protein FRC04_000826 [Tulasnella sp. 424]|nr:hypothetical protein FRC04_000826 [Tulasnella sp. 424]